MCLNYTALLVTPVLLHKRSFLWVVKTVVQRTLHLQALTHIIYKLYHAVGTMYSFHRDFPNYHKEASFPLRPKCPVQALSLNELIPT